MSAEEKDTTEQMEHSIPASFFRTMGYLQDTVEKVIRQ